MDADEETARAKWMLIVGLVFLVSAFFAWREMKYAVFGKEVNAQLVRVYETEERGRRGRRVDKLAVEYQFKDAGDGTIRKETDTLSINSPRPTGKTVPVQYMSGTPDRSRIKGHSNQIAVIIFLACTAFFGFKIFQLVRESKR